MPLLLRARQLLLAVAAACVVISCGGKTHFDLPPPTPARVGWTQNGVASWYGHPYHGRRTSNGEVYNMDKMTAAHLSLPFGTWVRVTNLKNKKSTEVRINDRGPFVKGRVIDLSREAAKRIAMLGPGTTRVRLQVVATPKMRYRPGKKSRKQEPVEIAVAPPEVVPARYESGDKSADLNGRADVGTVYSAVEIAGAPCGVERYYAVQVGSFQVLENAERMRGKIEYGYGTADIVVKQLGEDTLYRVVAGRFGKRSSAADLLGRLAKDGVEGFVTSVADFDDCS